MLAEEQIVGFRTVDAADLVDVAKALRRNQRGLGAFALQQRIDGDCRAVQEQLPRAETRSGFGDARGHALDQTRGCGQRLSETNMTRRFVKNSKIRECTAD